MSESEARGLRILSLDGGDSRCLSQLCILREFMWRLEQRTEKKLRPCDYFDMIVGVDASAAIATFLVTFGMSVDDAQDAFCKVYTETFKDNATPGTRGARLESAIQGLMDESRHEVRGDSRLSEVTFGGNCKLAICYTPAASMGHCSLFRNYSSPIQKSYGPTVAEALRAAWAIPGLISPAKVGPLQEEIVSATNGFNNPVREVIEEAYRVFGPDRKISCFLSLGSGKRGAISLENTQSNAHQTISAQIVSDSENIAEEMQKRLGRLGIYYRLSVDEGLEGPRPYRGSFGTISSHTDVYMARFTASKVLDYCLNAAQNSPGVTLEQLYHARIEARGSSHGLPPLSAFFVERKKPMEAIVKGLFEGDDFSQRIMVLSGLGGSGKTQLALKFARDFEDRFQHILFIDASSSESLQSSLIARVRSISYQHNPKSVEQALDILAQPDEVITADWLIIFDNFDNPDLKISQYFPTCDHGSILITTRNPMAGDLAPNSHLRLDVMSPEEAVEALIASVFPTVNISGKETGHDTTLPTIAPTQADRDQAAMIVEQLGYLPIAVVQAGTYINQQHCLHDYLVRLRANRLRLLDRPTRFHRDTLKYNHSVYAAFDVTLDVLSTRARRLMRILSFVHFSNFPRSLFAVAAKSGFEYQAYELLDQGPQFDEAVRFLSETLCPDGEWSEEELDDLLQELQQYSLVILVPMHRLVTLRFHPLAHSWARDRMSTQEQTIHRAAAVRLLSSGLDQDYYYYFDYLIPHIHAFTSVWDSLPLNDQAAFTQILRFEGNAIELVSSWEKIHQKVSEVHGDLHIRTSRAALQLADAYGQDGDWFRMENLERSVVSTLESIAGSEHPDTIYARANLARTAREKRDFGEATSLEKEVLRSRLQSVGVWHRDTANAMMDLGATFHLMSLYSDEQGLLRGALDIRTKVLGRSSVHTIQSLELLAECHYLQMQNEEAEAMQREALRLRQSIYGEQHLSIARTLEWLAARYWEQKRYHDAEVARREELVIRRRMQGDRHLDTLEAMYWAARNCYEQGHYIDSEKLWREELESRKVVMGDDHMDTINVKHWLARCCADQGKYAEAQHLWAEDLEGRKQRLGPDHEQTLNAMGWLAGAHFEQGNFAEAERLRRDELAGWRRIHKSLTGDVCHALHNLARALYSQGKFKEAEHAWREDLRGRRERLGDQHEQTLNAIGWTAMACYRQNKLSDAEKLRREELAGWKMMHGNISNEICNTLHWLARALLDQDRYDEAEELWREDLKGRTYLLGEKNSARLNAMGWLAFACFKNKKHAESEVLRRAEWEGWKEMQGGRDMDSLHARYWLAEACADQAKYTEAISLWEEELKIRKEVQGSRHQQVARTMGRLGEIYQLTGQQERAKQFLKEAIDVQRDIVDSDDETLLERLEDLLEEMAKEDGPMSEEQAQPQRDVSPDCGLVDDFTHENAPVQAAGSAGGQAPAIEVEVVEGVLGPDDESVAIIPAESAGLRPPSPLSRPVSPFQQRSLFGMRLNQWSMFF